MKIYSPRVIQEVTPSVIPYVPDIRQVDSAKQLEDLDPRVVNFNFIKRNLTLNPVHIDWVALTVGFEGSGKTNCMVRDAAEIDPAFMKQSKDLPCLFYSRKDVDYLLELTNKDNNYQRRGISVMCDEAHIFFYGKESLTKNSREMVKFLMTSRDKMPYYWGLGIQYFNDFSTYLRNSRGRSLAKTFWRLNSESLFFEAGFVNYYSRGKFLEIKIDTQRRQVVFPKPDFSTTFPKLDERFYEWMTQKKNDFRNKEGAYAYLKAEVKSIPLKEKAKVLAETELDNAILDKDFEEAKKRLDDLKKLRGV